MSVLIPDLLYQDGAFRSGLALEVSAAGRITRIAPAGDVDRSDAVRLPGRALLPGFINAHSHAFQRLIRGHTQWRPAGATVSDFWTWRRAMYQAALRLGPEEIYTVSRFCFIEMLRAGITSVGEFHYLHNDPHGAPYDDRAELARQVIRAARDAGIRISLLNVCYATGSIGQPLHEDQRRFATPELDDFLNVTDGLAREHAQDPHVSVGIAPHSIRAVRRDWLRPLHAAAVHRDMPFHMHVSEQPAEVDASVDAYGLRPVQLLHEDGLLDARFTGVHATHINDAELQALANSGATVCACPATERDLGDGMLRARDLLRAGGRIALGTDSQTVIDMLEDMRLVEYHERLRRLQRVVLTVVPKEAASEARLDPAPLLLEMATAAGARSLRIEAGTIAEGALADLVAVDLEHRVMAGWTVETLPAMLALSASLDVITDVWVGGRGVVRGGVHQGEEDGMRAFNRIARDMMVMP